MRQIKCNIEVVSNLCSCCFSYDKWHQLYPFSISSGDRVALWLGWKAQMCLFLWCLLVCLTFVKDNKKNDLTFYTPVNLRVTHLAPIQNIQIWQLSVFSLVIFPIECKMEIQKKIFLIFFVNLDVETDINQINCCFAFFSYFGFILKYKRIKTLIL